MHFVHQNKLILQKMKTFVDKQVKEVTEVFKFEGTEEAEKRKNLKSLLNLAMKAILSSIVKIA